MIKLGSSFPIWYGKLYLEMMLFITHLRHSHRRVSDYILCCWYGRLHGRPYYGFCSWSSSISFIDIDGVVWTTTWHIWITNTGDITISFILLVFICWKIIATSTLITPYKAKVIVAGAMIKTPESSTVSQVKIRVCNILTNLGLVSLPTHFQTTSCCLSAAWCCTHGDNSQDSSVPKQQQIICKQWPSVASWEVY